MRVFTKKKTDRGRRLSSEIFGSTHDDDNETRFETIMRPTAVEEEAFSLSEGDDKPESTSTATTSSSTSSTSRNPRVSRKRKSIETSTTSKKTSSFDTSDSESEKESDDSDYEVKKKKKKKTKQTKQTKKKRNSRTSQQDEEVDEEWNKKMNEFVQTANKFFNEVDATKLQKANLKEEEELLSKQAEKEILENAKREQESVKDAQEILKAQKASLELQREILSGSSSVGSSSQQPTQEELQQKEEDKKKQAKLQEYERYCRSVEGIMPPMSFEEYLLDGDTLIPASEITDLDDLDRV